MVMIRSRFVLLALPLISLPGAPLSGQRISPGYLTGPSPELVLPAGALRSAPHATPTRRAPCRPLERAFLIASAAAGGAFGGLVFYELSLGVWSTEEPDRTARRIRTTLIVGGGIIGAVYGFRTVSADCRDGPR
jgi:hypothetical protein